MPFKFNEKEIENYKRYYLIGEVAEIADCETSAIRFWESESVFKPIRKNKKGVRVFTVAQMRTAVTVKLLRWHGIDMVATRDAMEGGYAEKLLRVMRQLKAGQPVTEE